MSQLEIAVLVSSFERAGHVRRVLESLAVQRGVEGRMEVVVTDDGSRNDTPQIVAEFAAQAPFPVRFVTHEHAGFQLARCRNEGVAASTSPYLLFLDGDCLAPRDHVRTYLERRRPGQVLGGYYALLDRDVSERLTLDDVRRGEFVRHFRFADRWRLRKIALAAFAYNLVRSATRPKLIGGNIGIWRTDYERINGYDENFIGWGCEDDDLRLRLRRAGLRIESILWWTNTFHLWHPKTPSAPTTWRLGDNVPYHHRRCRMTRCGNGLSKRQARDLSVALVGDAPPAAVRAHWPTWLQSLTERQSAPAREIAEVELLVLPGPGRFTAQADCRIAIVTAAAAADEARVRQADIVLSEKPVPNFDRAAWIPLHALAAALESLFQRESPPSTSMPARDAA